MKTTLRKIVIDQTVYVYTKKRNYLGDEKTKFTLRIFKQGYKTTPVIIEFICQEDYMAGTPLNNGIRLFNHHTNERELINLNHPKMIRHLILLAIRSGWTGENQIPVQNGIDYLAQLGFIPSKDNFFSSNPNDFQSTTGLTA